MELNTAAKGTGGVLVSGGGGVGIYYISSELFGGESETIEFANIPVDSLFEEVKDEFDGWNWEVVGRAHSIYTDVYSTRGRAHVGEILNGVKSLGTRPSNSQVGQIIEDWCRKPSNKKSYKFKYWCTNKPTIAEKIKKEEPGKTPKTSKDDFNHGDYKKLEEVLDNERLSDDSWRMGIRKGRSGGDERAALLDWCKEQLDLLFFDDADEIVIFLKQYCFKNRV